VAVSDALDTAQGMLTVNRDHYMLGKCLWKMWTSPAEDLPPNAKRPEFDDALECIARAIEKLPSRDSRKDPILEPHYKLVSMVHKLVTVEALEVRDPFCNTPECSLKSNSQKQRVTSSKQRPTLPTSPHR
jgi:hypothetical protein